MHCKLVQADLLDFANRETSAARAWAIRRHIAACPKCASELAALQDFQASLRRADLVPPETVAAPPRLYVPRRRAYAAALAAVLIGCLFLYPVLRQSRSNVQNPGAAIAAALGRVNTWHFAGWKQINGKRVSWEIWGRRTPWLYYERVGDTVTWSDGKTCLRVFPPNPALNRPQGLLIKAASDQAVASSFLNDPAYQLFVDDPQAHDHFGDGATTLYAQTAAVAKYRRQNFMGMSGINENKLYTISKQDWLPTTYQLHFENPKINQDTEYLQVHYGEELPEEVVSAPAPEGYSVLDFTRPSKEAATPSSHTAESHGFKVQAEPVGMDKEGNVLIAVRGWLGGNRLLQDTTFTLSASPFGQTFPAKRGSQNLRYLYASNASTPPGDILYLPFLPLVVPHPLPNTLALDLTASPQVRGQGSDMIEGTGQLVPTTTTESLFTANFHWDLTLPVKPVPSLLTLLPPAQRRFLEAPGQIMPQMQQKFPNRSFEFALAEQRRIYYYMGYDYNYTALCQAAPLLAKTGVITPQGMLSPTVPGIEKVEAVRKANPKIFEKAKQEFRAHAVYWQKQAMALRPTGGSSHEEREQNLAMHLADLQLLAICYQAAGDTVNCNATLRRLIQECQPLPQHGGLQRRQAEFALRTGQFPGDADYKGPS